MLPCRTSFVQRVVRAMEHLAPLCYADTTFDNVGLLLDRISSTDDPPYRVALALDLTSSVVEECIERGANVLVCYHPAIFPFLKHISTEQPKQRALVLAARHGIAIYSPHTALDNCPNGINEWIIRGVSERVDHHARKSLQPSWEFCEKTEKRGLQLVWKASDTDLPTLKAVIHAVKAHYNLFQARISFAIRHTPESCIQTMGVCAGSGSTILTPMSGQVDLVITGEMGHHDILHLQQSGTTVLLVEHGVSERGYLKEVLLPRLRQVLQEQNQTENVDRDEVILLKTDINLLEYC